MSDKDSYFIVGSAGAGKTTGIGRMLAAELVRHFGSDGPGRVLVRGAEGGDQSDDAYWEAQRRRTLRSLIELMETDR